jgi:hypothetical protein
VRLVPGVPQSRDARGAAAGRDGRGGRRHDAGVTSPKLLLAAGSVAASLAGLGPAVTHGAAAPVRTGAAGITVSAAAVRAGVAAQASLSAPANASRLVGVASGSPALAGRVRLTVTRASAGATLFTGSLATFHALPVQPGTRLVVSLTKPGGYAGLTASAQLRWS